MVNLSTIKLALLVILIIVFIVFAPMMKKNPTYEPFQASADGGIPTDADNPNIPETGIYGEVPSAASISIFKKAEAKGATANPDALQANDNTGQVMVDLTEIPDQPPDPEDIESQLNATVEGFLGNEGFQNPANQINVGAGTVKTFGNCPPGSNPSGAICMTTGFPMRMTPRTLACPSDRDDIGGLCYAKCPSSHPNRMPGLPMMCTRPATAPPAPAAPAATSGAAAAAASAAAQQQLSSLGTASGAIGAARNPLAFGVSTAVGAGVAAAGVGAAGAAMAGAVGGGAAGAVASKGIEMAQADLQARAEEKAQEKVMNAVSKKSKKVIAKAQKAKKIALKGAKKVATKISNKLSQKLGKSMLGKVLSKVAKKIAEVMGKKAAIATAKGAALSATGVGAAFGILLSVIAAIGIALQIAIAAELKGDEGVCEEGWSRVSEKWPSYLNDMPGVGDIMGALAPYLCYKDACDPGEDESAGLCYEKCVPGYDGLLTMCWAGKAGSDAVKPMKRPCGPGLRDDQTSCWQDTLPNGVGTIPPLNPCPPGHRDDGTSCWETTGQICGDDCSKGWDGCRRRTERKCTDWGFGRQTCVGGDCVGGCREGCKPLERISRDAFSRGRTCPPGKNNVDGLCFNSCPPGYSYKGGSLCEPPGGPGIRTTLGEREYCNPDREWIGDRKTFGMCYSKCPPSAPNRVPGLPMQCSTATKVGQINIKNEKGNGWVSYDRGVGKPKLKLKMVKPTPPPPPPPPSHFSSYYADDPTKKCFLDFSSTKALGDMAQFYYRAARINADENKDGTITFSYISKITKVVASSERSCDILCDITTVNMNSDTGKTNTSTTTSNNDRRFYFAVIDKTCSFIVTAATNMNDTAPDVKNVDNTPKDVNFVPTLDRCKDLPISLKRCQNPNTIDAMMNMYTKTQANTVRVKSIIGAQNLSSNTCGVSWSEVNYDPNTNVESAPTNKSGIFTFTQDKSNDACAYNLQKFDAASGQTTIKALDTPISRPLPLPNETTLQGCQNKCSDPALVTKMINAFNNQPNNPNRILSVRKAFTSNALRCDLEADVYVKATKKTEVQRIRFDMAKDGGSCVFNVAKVGDAVSGTFIQANTPALGASVNTSDFIISQAQGVLKSVESKLGGIVSQMTGYLGKANTSFEKSLADVGQIQTLGNCPKKCSDPDILEAIATHYNTTNYPKTRMNVTKKTMERVLKAATSSSKTCDITFEEKQEYYTDLYSEAPKVTVTQKTQRFSMVQGDTCTFSVEQEATPNEGFQNITSKGGLPGLSKTSFVNSQSPVLTPPFSARGCELDCSKVENMNSMRDLYGSQNIEGFQTMKPKKTFRGLLSSLREAYQDYEEAAPEEGVTDWETQEAEYTEEAPAEEEATYEEEAPAEGEPTYEEEVPAEPGTSSVSRTLKKVNQAFKVSPDTCEYEVTYDKSSTDEYGNVNDETDVVGYFTAKFSKDTNGCHFTATSISESQEPVLPSVPQARKQVIDYSF